MAGALSLDEERLVVPALLGDFLYDVVGPTKDTACTVAIRHVVADGAACCASFDGGPRKWIGTSERTKRKLKIIESLAGGLFVFFHNVWHVLCG
eukprot:4163899-Amphidinium_carterae.1